MRYNNVIRQALHRASPIACVCHPWPPDPMGLPTEMKMWGEGSDVGEAQPLITLLNVLRLIVLWHAVAHCEGMFNLPRRALLAPQPLVPSWGPAVLPAAHGVPPSPHHCPQRRLCKVAAGIEQITGEVRSHCSTA